MSKLAIFECTTCKRKIEIEIDKTRVDPVNCIITNRCNGKMAKVGEKNTRTTIYPTPVSGVQDWTPRGADLQPKESIKVYQFSILSGSNHIAIAVPEATATPFHLRFKSDKTNYTPIAEYYFVLGAETTGISGNDNSNAGNILHCGKGDTVKIFNNGVEMPSSDFKVLDNKIQFLVPLKNEKNILSIAIFNSVARENTILTFNKVINAGESSWDNIKKVEMNGKIYDVLICNDLSGFMDGYAYTLLDYDNNQSDVEDVFFLLSTYPYSSFDRILTTRGIIKSMMNEKTKFYYKIGTKKSLNVDKLTPVFPQIKIIERNRYSPDFSIDTQSIENQNGHPNKTIIGPI